MGYVCCHDQGLELPGFRISPILNTTLLDPSSFGVVAATQVKGLENDWKVSLALQAPCPPFL